MPHELLRVQLSDSRRTCPCPALPEQSRTVMVGEGTDALKMHKNPRQGLPHAALGWCHVAHSNRGLKNEAPSASEEHRHLPHGSLHWGPALCGDSGRGVQTPQASYKFPGLRAWALSKSVHWFVKSFDVFLRTSLSEAAWNGGLHHELIGYDVGTVPRGCRGMAGVFSLCLKFLS